MKTPYASLLPPLSDEEFKALRADIKANGVRQPVAVDEAGNVLDGHHRLKIDPAARTITIRGLTEPEKRAWVYRTNNARRNLSAEQKRELAKAMRQTACDLKGQGKPWTQAKIAAALGVDRTTVSRWLDTNNVQMHKASKPVDLRTQVPSDEYPIIAAQVAAGTPQAQVAANYGVSQQRVSQICTAAGKRKAKTKERKRLAKAQAKKPPADRRYATVVIDPPWPMKKIERQKRINQADFDYPTMSVERLGELAIPAMRDCHLYLWVTQRFLPAGLELARMWGFKYQCVLTWVKNVGFTPFSWMYSTEHVLFCTRGSLPLLKKGLRLDFKAKVREHSRKPEEFYALVQQASPGPRVDMFAREVHNGFEQWGNEPGKFEAA